MMLTIALMGLVCRGYAQNKKTNNKPAPKTESDKPVFSYKKNNAPVKSTAAISDNSELISFSAEGTYIARYPKAIKLASK